MKIVVDLDGVICQLKKNHNESYADLKPIKDSVNAINSLRDKGHYIIIATARNMQTYESNLGKVMKNVGKVTLDWLEKYNIKYDEIYFGKPNADIYIDDRALNFESWSTIDIDNIQDKGKSR